MATFATEDKSAWNWTMMITVPGRGDRRGWCEDARAAAVATRSGRTPSSTGSGSSVSPRAAAAQVLHVGPYGAEGSDRSRRLHAFVAERAACDAVAVRHHEIYVGDPASVGTPRR